MNQPVTNADWEALKDKERAFAKAQLRANVPRTQIIMAIALAALTNHDMEMCLSMIRIADERVQEAFRSL